MKADYGQPDLRVLLIALVSLLFPKAIGYACIAVSAAVGLGLLLMLALHCLVQPLLPGYPLLSPEAFARPPRATADPQDSGE